MTERFYPLQNVTLPDRTLCSETRLYYQIQEGVAAPVESNLRLPAAARVSFDTWFGGFSIGKWQRLSVCESFALKLVLQGKGVITLYRQRRYKGRFHSDILNELVFDASEPQTFVVPLSGEHAEGDRLFFVLSVERDSILQQAQWGTFTPPQRSVRLGLVITTFNRQHAVAASAQRLSRFIERVNCSGDQDIKVSLAIVDNGRNLSLPSLPGVEVIPNPNLGGAGGFARGLYHFKHESPATHCLFMDDDAACEPESIWRTLQLLAYAQDDRLAIAGAMLKDAPAYLLHEKGARFNGHCIPLHQDRDVRSSGVLAKVEQPAFFDYGGWWFFAFPLKHVTHYPFPFFVRGDDVQFGLSHDFTLETLNGVSVWGGDFTVKESPMSKYLDMRHHLMQHLITEQLPNDPITLSVMIWRQWLRYGLTFRYAIAEAQLMALEDVLKGPTFWARNADMHETFPRLRILMQQMAPRSLENSNSIPSYITPKKRSFLRVWGARLAKIVTLNGYLVPKMFLNRQPVSINKGDVSLQALSWRICAIQVEPDGKSGVWLKRDYGRFFHLVTRFSVLTLRLMLKRRGLVQAYRQAYPALTSEAFWCDWFEAERQVNRE